MFKKIIFSVLFVFLVTFGCFFSKEISAKENDFIDSNRDESLETVESKRSKKEDRTLNEIEEEKLLTSISEKNNFSLDDAASLNKGTIYNDSFGFYVNDIYSGVQFNSGTTSITEYYYLNGTLHLDSQQNVLK